MVIERDAGLGVTALFRNVYLVDLREVDATGFLDKVLLVDLTKVPDPGLVSLPAIHTGDLGLGDPFWVMCESVEAVHVTEDEQLLIGCDNNLPNSGRNPGLADDNEFIVVDVPALDIVGRRRRVRLITGARLVVSLETTSRRRQSGRAVMNAGARVREVSWSSS